ncbi:hypothetical protein Syun_014473 [Stephania yunnanensis]|uniref:Uncharacterized protein n=1 Tax=Stephania yunnanensis TaxID=152371 RepID=A0AAP0P8L3_9MAGN
MKAIVNMMSKVVKPMGKMEKKVKLKVDKETRKEVELKKQVIKQIRKEMEVKVKMIMKKKRNEVRLGKR